MEESTLTLPNDDNQIKTSELDKYKLRLVQARVKTEEDLNNMSEDTIKNLYLKHEQGVIDNMSKLVHKWFVKAYTNIVNRIAFIKEVDELEKDLNEDVFLKAGIKEVFPTIYYQYGVYLAPLSVLATTVAHIDYNPYINDNGEEKSSQTIPGTQQRIEQSSTSGSAFPEHKQ